MEEFHGIQVYEILENGNLLNAVYTNTRLLLKNGIDYYIDSEIARKVKKASYDNKELEWLYDNNGVEGLYYCRYIEANNPSVEHCYLEISKRNGVYEFTWIDQNKNPRWKGLGLMSGTSHIAVSYIGV